MVYPDSWLIPPQRRRGNNTLVVVPHDIWSNIVENFRPSPDLTFRESREDLTSLSLTCRYFCVITRPLLFEEMVFVGGSKNPGVAVRDFTGWFYEAGKKEPGSLGAFVKTYQLLRWRSIDSGFSELTERHLDVIVQLPNLQKLVLHEYHSQNLNSLINCFCTKINTTLRPSSLRHICFNRVALESNILLFLQELPALETLLIESCTVANASEPCLRLQPIRAASRLRQFKFTVKNTGRLIVLVPADFVASVVSFTCQPSLRIFFTDSQDMARSLCTTSSVPLVIEELGAWVNPNDMPSFSSFLNRTPSITKLYFELAILERSIILPLGLEASALPRLTSLRCPHSYILPLAAGRPVHHYWMTDCSCRNCGTSPAKDLLGLTRSKVPIKELRIYPVPYQEASLATLFPDLESLTISRGTFRECLPLLKDEVLHLEHLHIRCKIDLSQFSQELEDVRRDIEYDLPSQRCLLKRLVTKFPYLLSVCFYDSFFQWRRQTHDSDDWKPYCPCKEEARQCLTDFALGHTRPHPLVDENGFIMGIADRRRQASAVPL